jgi:thiol-disulfide isomerase/thioredoxin
MNQRNVSCAVIFLSILFSGVAGCDRTAPPRTTEAQTEDAAKTDQDLLPQSGGPQPGTPDGSMAALLSSEPLSDWQPGPQFDLPPFPTDQGSHEQSGTAESESGQQQWTVPVQPMKSSDPEQMVRHLADIEQEIQNLVVTARRMDQEQAQHTAVQLSQLKLIAAEHLDSLPNASNAQRITARKSRLVALSHLSGLKDVRAAKQLSDYARQLLEDDDAELRHQAAIVLFGFQIQELQNGILTDPSLVVDSARRLVVDPAYRSRLEMTSMGHAINVLYQMGFAPQAGEIEKIAFEVFSDSPDRELRNEAWNQITRNSQSVANFINSLQSLGSLPSEMGLVLAAARDMVQQHPDPVTLEMITGVIIDMEYGGQLPLSVQLTELVDGELEKYPPGVSVQAITAALSEHRQRVLWVGQTLSGEQLDSLKLIDTDGIPLDPAAFEGKVVLIDFWATWCLPCIQEIPFLRRAHQELYDRGFRVLSINMDKEPARLNQFLQNNRLPWKTYRAESGDSRMLTEKFGITLFPHTILMRQDGTVASLHVRGENLNVQVERLLAQ